MTVINIQDFLEHHGVKGQKWGVRRKSKGPKVSGPDISKMSDQQLRDVISRIQLEKQYKDLTKHNSSMESGKKFAVEILKDVGRQKAKSALIAAPGVIASVVTGAYIAKKMVG